MRIKPVKWLTRELLINSYYCLFLIALLYKFFWQVFGTHYKEDYNITEWLVNYQGGFVRRGLLGEILYQVSTYSGIDPVMIILIFSFTFFFLLGTFFVRSFIKKGYPIFILPFVFFLGFPIINDIWLRKDSLILILFVAVLYLFKKKPKGYFLWMNLLLIFGILSHELIALIALPILFFLLYSRYKPTFDTKASLKSILYSFAVILPSILAFFVVSIHKGNEQVAIDIWNSWDSVYFANKYPEGVDYRGAIVGIGWSMADSVNFTLGVLFNYSHYCYAFIGIMLQILVVFYISMNVNSLNNKVLGIAPKQQDQTVVTGVLLFQAIVALLPMCIAASDYGRWTYFWTVSSFAILLIIPADFLRASFPAFMTRLADRFYCTFTRLLGNSKGVVILLCIFATQLYAEWNIMRNIESSSIYIVFSFISRILRIILMNLFPFLESYS